MDDNMRDVFVDMQKQKNKELKRKDIIIAILIIFLFVEPIVLYAEHLWYESQYEYTETTKEEQKVEVSTSGDNANAEYNDVNGNQYNDNATHSESGETE